jgi:hypothetical protein
MPELEPGGQTDEAGLPERSPESIGARVFLHSDAGLVVLCPSEDTRTVVEEKDEQGRVIKDKRISESGVILYFGEYQYDDRGKNRRMVLKDYKGQVFGTIESFRESMKEGRAEVDVYYDAQGKKLTSIEHNYDQNDRLQSIVHRDEKGKVSGFNNIEFEYDKHDRESRKVYTDKNGDIHMTIEYERDENGRIYHTIVRDGEGNIIDEIGQAREKPESAGDYGDARATEKTAPESKTGDKESIDVKYDEHGKVIERIFYDENKNIKMSIEYERDETGKKFHTVIKNDIGIIIEEFWEPDYQEAA